MQPGAFFHLLLASPGWVDFTLDCNWTRLTMIAGEVGGLPVLAAVHCISARGFSWLDLPLGQEGPGLLLLPRSPWENVLSGILAASCLPSEGSPRLDPG